MLGCDETIRRMNAFAEGAEARNTRPSFEVREAASDCSEIDRTNVLMRNDAKYVYLNKFL